jgi:hypothetical protein
LNVSTEPLKTMGRGSRFQSNIVSLRKIRFVSLSSLNTRSRRDIARQGMHVLWLSEWWLKSVFFSNSYISLTLLYIMTSRARLHHVTNTRCVSLSVGDEPCSPVLDHFKISTPKWWSNSGDGHFWPFYQ